MHIDDLQFYMMIISQSLVALSAIILIIKYIFQEEYRSFQFKLILGMSINLLIQSIFKMISMTLVKYYHEVDQNLQC